MAPDPQVSPEVTPPQLETAPPPGSNWFRKVTAVVFVIFCFEIGLFLLVYPWTPAWTDNTISVLAPGAWHLPWRKLWNDYYFRGIISGAGLLNLWIALTEVLAMFRRSAV